jgi:hypothetical protein
MWFDILSFLDDLYHKSGDRLPLRWACDRYDNALIEASEPPAWALRCPVCEGIQYPGLGHNQASPECTYYTGHGYGH